MILDDFIDFTAHGRATAFVDHTAFRAFRYSRAQTEQGIAVMGSWLLEQGTQPGDRVILWAGNSARWAMMFYACVRLRLVAVPIDASFSQSFVDRIRKLTEARCVWQDAGTLPPVKLAAPLPVLAPPDPDSLLEILYTSGTTGDPKGVMITHGNLVSNLEVVQREVLKYRKYARPFSPLGFVHLIPLSHLFGQIMGLFIPQMLEGTVIFSDPIPSSVIRAVKANRASAIICVPHELSLLRSYVAGRRPESAAAGLGSSGIPGVLKKWWKHREVHREFGWKFWAFISGGASLPREDEDFWSDLGFAVIQGYGLTETAPTVTIAHPFQGLRRGSVGKKLPGLEVRIEPDGEILVKGPNVSPGYYRNEAATGEVFRDGWLHTGDLGRFDDAGNLVILGRKKDVIVTSNGLNVYPKDVEAALEQDPHVKEAAVVGRDVAGRPQVHAVLVLQPGAGEAQAARAVEEANGKLESYQRIQSWSLWPEKQLPRTTTGKLMRFAVASGALPAALRERSAESLLEQLMQGTAGDRRLDEDLGLSSLDRVELLVEMEQRTGRTIDESAFASARTLGDVSALVQAPPTGPPEIYRPHRWATGRIIEGLRMLSWYTLVFPAMPLRMRVEASGLDELNAATPPFLFVCNHQGMVDVPAILKALPMRLRRKLAPAMGPGRKRWENLAAGFFFNAYPLPGTSAGLREAIQHTGDLADRGYCPLVFPEGARTPDGKLLPFRPGIGVIVKQTRLPVVPIFLEGAYEVWPIHARGPRKGRVRVTFGKLLDFSGREPAEIVAQLESLYRRQHGVLGGLGG